MRKLINRKGSTLALTIIIFAVLMIFASFTLGFMVTENKQAMYHQNKTQAYYIARSGAVSVEKAIQQVFNIDGTDQEKEVSRAEVISLMNNLSTEPVIINSTDIIGEEALLTDGNADLYIELSKTNDNSAIFIDSHGIYNSRSEVVRKVLPINIDIETNTESLVISGDKPLIVLNDASQNLKDEEWVTKEIEKAQQYRDVIETIKNNMTEAKPTIENIPPDGAGTIHWGSTIGVTEYYIDGFYNPNASEIVLDGDVNLYVSGYVLFDKDLIVNSSGNHKLNIYIYGEQLYQAKYSLFVGGYKDNQNFDTINLIFNGTIYVKNGDIAYNVQDAKLTGNIFTASEEFIIRAQTSNVNDYSFKGLIFAPYTDIFLGTSTDQFVTTHEGYVIADNIQHSKNQIHSKTEYGIPSGDGINEIETEIITIKKIMTPLTGYFR